MNDQLINLPELTYVQYEVIHNVMSFAIASMFAGALFFFFARTNVAPKYRPAMLITALVPAIACYHYFRIYDSFGASYTLSDGSYIPSGIPFNDAYRYMDWLLTVPLLVIELVAVLGLATAVTRRLSTKLAVAAALMIALGYPGEISSTLGTQWLFWILSMIPFLYILFVLFTEFSKHYQDQPDEVRPLVSKARLVILITWSFYPLAYLAPMFMEGNPAAGETALQIGYTIADITAKVGFGIFIYFVAVAKTRADGWTPEGTRGLASQSQPASA